MIIPSFRLYDIIKLLCSQLVNHVYFSPDGQWVASASFDKSVKLWNGTTGKFVAAFRGHVGPVYQISWSADSRLILSGSKDSTLKVWDIRTRKLRQDLPGHADEVCLFIYQKHE